jgi:hypothetical protein
VRTRIAAALIAIAVAAVIVVVLLMQKPAPTFGYSINNTLTVGPP